MAMSPWQPTTDKKLLRRMGKTLEELAELSSVCARIIIQGLDEIDPASGLPNRQRLINETADVLTQCQLNIKTLGLPESDILDHQQEKFWQMREWEALVAEPEPPVNTTPLIRKTKMREIWKAYLDGLSEAERRKILDAAIARLMEIEEVRFRVPEPDEDVGSPYLYWESCGESLLKVD